VLEGVQCKITDAAGIDRIGMLLQVPTWSNYSPFDPMGMNGYTSNSFKLAWGLVSSPGWTWIPITFEYEDAPCPCY
jgi:hypothetical protein